jgi:hypothetical protein
VRADVSKECGREGREGTTRNTPSSDSVLTDDHLVDLVEEVHDELDLVRDLCPPEDGEEGPLGIVQGLAEVLELLLQEEAGRAHGELHADHGRVGAVGSAEGVVNCEPGRGISGKCVR